MTGIIERLESATEGSRELDEAIYDAIGRPGDDDPQEYSFLHGDCPPAYSTSLDAALPGENIRDVRWQDAYDDEGDAIGEHWVACHVSDNGEVYAGSHPTSEAIARRIASLRAREQG
jgi:hypothetical protein